MIRPGEDRLLIFDCDGVLVDSEPLANRVLNDALNRLGIEIGLEESTAKFTGLSMGSCMALAEAAACRILLRPIWSVRPQPHSRAP
jgi:beta-phosphoglucomutase-like phosphatase (HAD superfamily)